MSFRVSRSLVIPALLLLVCSCPERQQPPADSDEAAVPLPEEPTEVSAGAPTPGDDEDETADPEIAEPDEDMALALPRSPVEFIAGPRGVDVVEGRVDLLGEGEPVRVEAGRRFQFRREEEVPLDTEAIGPTTAHDGIPLEIAFWRPEPEPFGEKPASFQNDEVGDGWLLADPPSRWARDRRVGSSPRVGVKTPRPGTLQLEVPSNSRLDSNGDTAPRLLHKATGDLDLYAVVTLDDAGSDPGGVWFIVRSPGSSAGIAAGQFRRAPGGGAGQHYWNVGAALLRRGDEVIRVQALNESSRGRWPEAPGSEVHVRLLRRGNVWATGWSADGGRTWNLGAIDLKILSETLWVGMVFVNHGRAADEPLRFKVRDLRLSTAETGSKPAYEWYGFARSGKVTAEEDRVHLELDGEDSGSARAYSLVPLLGDFELEVAFRVDPDEEGVDSSSFRRWGLGAVTGDGQGVWLGVEPSSRGLRFGVVQSESAGYRPDRNMQWGRERLDARGGRLRMIRREGVISAYYRADDEEGEYLELPYRQQHERKFAGPLFVRMEATNSSRGSEAASYRVTFSVKRRADAAPRE